MRRLLLILTLCLAPLGLRAQEAATGPAVLVADSLFIEADRTLVARGNVEAFRGNTRLRASAIRYDRETGALTIEGPILLTEGTEQVVLADAGELTPDLREGLLIGARMILNQQLQLAANQVDRVGDRYSQLYKVSATSCRICTDGGTPLWSIRAQRVVHDRFERQLYFDHAQFRILDVPVFYIPRLRLPGPGLDRATGFLVPSVRSSSQLGLGIKVPYFIRLGDHRDLTLTPYLSGKTKTLQFRYRQAFVRGRVEFNGAVTRDDIIPDSTRGYLIGRGFFDLERGFKLSFDLETVTDDSYFPQYEYYNQDRLESQLTVSRARRDELIRASFYNFESLRDGENNQTLPTLVLDGEYERRFFPDWAAGGELRFALQAHTHRRNSDLSVDSADPDTVVDGRDVSRINGSVNWLRRDTFGPGLVTDLTLGARFGLFNIAQDSTFPQNHAEIVPQAALALRYPLVRRGTGGVTQLLEPLMQVAWTGGDRLNIPNEESTRPEFDEGNLLQLSRFPAPDRIERGGVAALGLNWARFNPNGWDAHVALGQVFRENRDSAFTETSGLGGLKSDYLVAAQLRSGNGITLTGRGLLDEDFGFSKAELRGDWGFAKGNIGGSYIFLDEDPAANRIEPTSEIQLGGSYSFTRHWAAAANYRFDLEEDRSGVAGLGISYDNECVTVDLSVSRTYSSSSTVEPTTNFGFNVGLRGFAVSDGTERYRRSCNY